MNKLYIILLICSFAAASYPIHSKKAFALEDEWKDLSEVSKQGALISEENAAIKALQNKDELFPIKDKTPQPVTLKGLDLLDEVIKDFPIDESDYGLEEKISKIISKPQVKETTGIYTPDSNTNRKRYDYSELPSKFFQNNSNKGVNTHLPKYTAQKELSAMLFAAVMDNNVSAIKTLLQRGADINVRTENSGMTPVMVCVKYNKPDVLRYLIAKGANLEYKSSNGKTALHYSVIHDLPKIFEMLINSGAKPYIKDNDGIIAPEYANAGQKNKYYLIIARTHQQNSDSLREFVKNSNLAAVNYLIEKGVSFNESDASGNTPLMIASSNGDHQMVSLLLAKGALFDNRNTNKLNAYDLAKLNGDYNTIALIETAMISHELEVGNVPSSTSIVNTMPEMLTKKTKNSNKQNIEVKSAEIELKDLHENEKASQAVIVEPKVYQAIDANNTEEKQAQPQVINETSELTLLEKMKEFFSSDENESSTSVSPIKMPTETQQVNLHIEDTAISPTLEIKNIPDNQSDPIKNQPVEIIPATEPTFLEKLMKHFSSDAPVSSNPVSEDNIPQVSENKQSDSFNLIEPLSVERKPINTEFSPSESVIQTDIVPNIEVIKSERSLSALPNSEEFPDLMPELEQEAFDLNGLFNMQQYNDNALIGPNSSSNAVEKVKDLPIKNSKASFFANDEPQLLIPESFSSRKILDSPSNN